MHYVTAFIGALLGAAAGIDGGLFIGGLLGFVAGMLWQQASRIQSLESRLDALDSLDNKRPPDDVAEVEATAPPITPAAPEPAVATSRPPEPTPAEPAGEPTAAGVVRAATLSTDASTRWGEASPGARTPDKTPSRLDAVREKIVGFLTTGNPVVRIGAIVLFIGVAFLLRYAYEHSLVPVELRLAGAGLGGIVLLIFGWRLRERADTYGLVLQGAGIGILYLTIFAAARLYGLLPMGAAFIILVGLVAGACVLAVMQKSQALAIFSMSGGFLAPILTSTGSGSHVALFSYYALLNGGIVGMAWFQHWRWLNWTGFVFTFVIGAVWGYQYYQPEYFATTQPFLILFFIFYLAVSVLFARRETVELKGVVDGTLVFGTPVIAFVLQAGLVEDMPFGLAYSALAAAIVYTGLAIWLKKQDRISGLLDESFIALAVVFATLAIPFAFDNQRFTAATWALEGAGIVWIGVRQSQLLPRAFGLLLQFAAGVAFASEIGRDVGDLLFLNSAYMGAAFLGAAGVFTACLLQRHRESVHGLEALSRWIFLGWGVFWWLMGGIRELGLYTPGESLSAHSNVGEHLFLIYTSVSVVLLGVIAGRIRWSEGLYPGFLLLPIAALILVNLDIEWVEGTSFTNYGWIAWPLMLGVFYWHLKQVDEFALSRFWHAGGWWFATLLATWNAAAWVDTVFGASVWTYVLWGAVPLAAAVAMMSLEDRDGWPFDKFREAYSGWGLTIALGYLLVWLLATGPVAGDPTPIPYVVLINPLELVQAAILTLGVYWVRRRLVDEALTADTMRIAATGVAGVAFVWINFVAMRAVHFYADVSYPVERILQSDVFQSTATILWTTIALVLMGLGTRRSVRLSWLVGAGLLAVVIIKLFIVDMGQLNLVARIISFITVGVLMLVIGYLAPLPPKRLEAESA